MEDCLRFALDERPQAMECQKVLSLINSAIPLLRGEDVSVGARSSGLLHALGQIQLENSMMDKAREYYRQSLKVSESVGDEEGRARAMDSIGKSYYLEAEYAKAEQWHIKSRDLCFKIRNELGFVQSLYALGNVYRMRKEYSKAEKLYIGSRDLYSILGNQLGIAHSAWALGDVYKLRNEPS